MNQLSKLHETITQDIIASRQREMAQSIAAQHTRARQAQEREQKAMQALQRMGLDVANLQAFDLEIGNALESQRLESETRMNALSEQPLSSGLDVETALLPEGATVLTPAWSMAFSNHNMQSELTGVSDISTQDVLWGSGAKGYWNWARGAGSGLFGSGEGQIQSWIDFGFWFRPPVSRFYSIQPLFRFRGYVIVQADDGVFTSKEARVRGTAWVNVHQYNWKGWNSETVYNDGGDNINLNTRRDIDRRTYNSYLLGGGDWAFIQCTIGLYAYARGSGSYARNDFATGAANYLDVPNVIVL
jgi:hypothetical protein